MLSSSWGNFNNFKEMFKKTSSLLPHPGSSESAWFLLLSFGINCSIPSMGISHLPLAKCLQ